MPHEPRSPAPCGSQGMGGRVRPRRRPNVADVPALYVMGDRDMVTSVRPPDGGGSLS